MALKMIDMLTNYLMPLENATNKKRSLVESNPSNGNKLTNLQVHTNQPVTFKMMIVLPVRYDDVCDYADHLKANTAVVINLSHVGIEVQQAIRDFMNGVCYALGGNSQRITDSVFMYVPANVDVDKQLYSYSVPTYIKPMI